MGNCSMRGRVTFNTELPSAPPELRQEVIVQELIHLKLPKHGALSKALNRMYLAQPVG